MADQALRRVSILLLMTAISSSGARALAATAAECAETWRAKVVSGLAFVPAGHAGIDSAFARFDQALEWPQADRARYSVEVSNDSRRTTELAVDRAYARATGDRVERSARLTLAPLAGGGVELRVVLEAKRYGAETGGGEVALETAREVLAAADDCALEPRELSMTSLAPSEVETRRLARKTSVSAMSALGGEARETSRLVPTEFLRNARRAELLSRNPSLIDRAVRLFVFVDVDAPDALLEIDPLERAALAFDAVTGRVEKLNQARVSTAFAGTSFFEGRLRWSTRDGFSALTSAASEARVVDEAAWTRARLDASEANAVFQVSLKGGEAFPPGERATLVINKPLEFPGLAQYWTIEGSAQPAAGNETPRWSYALRAAIPEGSEEAKRAAPVAPEDRWGRPELRATKWIEADLPAVREAATSALAHARAADGSISRARVAEEALAETAARINGFDPKMAAGDAPPMTTSETLARASGVCQHFANLFVAIARAAGLPARIVAGARLQATSAELHAWAEFESADGGVWVPVEPQSRTLEFPAGRYLPLAVSAVLDDPSNEAAVAAEMAAFFQLRASIESRASASTMGL